MTHQTERLSRNTTFSVVERIRAIHPHPDPFAERIEVIELTSGIKLVTGKHYRAGDRGVYLRPGCLIPGWLAEQLWLVGKKRALAWFEVRDIPIGIRPQPGQPEGPKQQSPGLWCGEWYLHDNTEESLAKAAAMKADGAEFDADGYLHWIFWREEWKEGFTLDGHFGIVEAVPPMYELRQDGSHAKQIQTRHDPSYTRRGNITERLRTAQNDVIRGDT